MRTQNSKLRKFAAALCSLCVLCGVALSISFPQIGAGMPALTFGGASSDRVDCGSAAVLDDLTTLTVMAWVYPTSLANNTIIVSKYRGSSADGWGFRTANSGGSSGEIEIAWEPSSRTTTNTAPLSSTNKWYFVAATINRATNTAHIYVGDLTTAPSEPTYSFNSWSGSYNSDAARKLFVGNRDNTTPNGAFNGRIAWAALYNTDMALADIKTFWLRPYVRSGALLTTHLGWAGTGTQADLSGRGNSCTVTGATVASHAPIARYP